MNPKMHARSLVPLRYAAVLVLTSFGAHARADLAMETETARLVEPGHFELGTAFEFQTAPDGREYAVPMAIEVGVYRHLELLIEPVAVTSIQPKTGESATGIGDLETTLTYLIIEEKKYVPAFAIAGEVKFPTAGNRQIGSGEFDYRFYAVASKRVGAFDIHLNLGYNIIGSPPGVDTKNPIDVEAGVEWFAHPKFDLFTEINYIASSTSSPGSGEGAAAVVGPAEAVDAVSNTPEIAGEEIVGTVGIRVHATRNLDVFGSFSYDNNNAKLFRTGVTIKF